MAESATAWHTKQKDRAVNTQVKRPDIPGDYGGHNTPPVPVTGHEGFIGSLPEQITWFAVIGGATLLLITIYCVNGLNKR